MTTKKPLGYILIAIAILLTLALIGQLTEFLRALFGIFKIFSGKVDGFQRGQAIGSLIYWVLHIMLTVYLFKVGGRWIKNRS
jgi:hypothetical protein